MSLARSRGQASARHDGQVVVIFALFLLVLVGFSALVIDMGSYLLARRNYQNIADSAALAGSAYLVRPIGSIERGNAYQASWDYLDRALGISGPADKSSGTGATAYTENAWSIWMSSPASAAGSAYLGDQGLTAGASMYVRIERSNPAFLSRVFGFNGRTIRGWATAGTQPSGYAVIALCPKGDPSCPPTSQSLTINGTNTILRVARGDIGDNWGLKTSGGTQLQLVNDSQAYLEDTTCGNGSSYFRCYPDPTNVNDGAGNAREVRRLPALVSDPGYAAPAALTDSTAVPNRPNVTISNGSGTLVNGTAANVTCSPSSPRIGPGKYNSIDVKANSCVILDPTTGMSNGQRAGIFYITGSLSIGNGSYVIGDGVSLFFDSGMSAFNPSGGLILNMGNQSGNADYTSGAWTTTGNYNWSTNTASPPLSNSIFTTPTTYGAVGMAVYVMKPNSGTTSIFNMSGTTPLEFNGVLYAPKDNVGIAGAGSQAAVGQIVGWTLTYSGNTTISQVYQGPLDYKSYLLEPYTGQGD